MRIDIFLSVIFILSFAAAPAHAADVVVARTNINDDYSRLVFEWPAEAAYSVSKQGDRVLIRFARTGTLDSAAAVAGNVSKIERLSAAGEPLQVAVTIPQGSRFRDFTVGNKTILDVYDSAKKTAPPLEEKSADPPKKPAEELAAADKPAANKPAPATPATQTTAATEKPDLATPSVKTTVANLQKLAAAQPEREVEPAAPLSGAAAQSPVKPWGKNVISLTTTSAFGMSVFERGGWLWMVADRPGLDADPQMTGPQKGDLPLEKVEIEDGTAYRLIMPEGLSAKVEGGGLSWQIVLEPGSTPAASVPPSKSGESGNENLFWPLKNQRKAIDIVDPTVGDTITAITSSNAGQNAGAAQSFVQVQTLDSKAGLAFIARSDDVNAKVAGDGVRIGRPGGLILSSDIDMKPEQIRQAIETPPDDAAQNVSGTQDDAAIEGEDADRGDAQDMSAQPPPESAASAATLTDEKTAQAVEAEIGDDAVHVGATKDDLAKIAEQKPSGNNIYDFRRWEMGGINALDDNIHVLMTEVANKPEKDRTVDFITMAKLLIANNRGPEALGMLRIASLQVPALEDNAEFQALRAAALALSGKFDEAIEDYGRESLANYDDAKYWRAYTLAGLEDWAQAGKVMPSDIAPVLAYPEEVRTPMLLALTEVALRNGKLETAQALLDALRPALKDMPLRYASSWNYLAGEAARQAGDGKEASALWEPLVKDGKDDLFRAKAGLSLTRLQIEQKKLNPKDAIDRLEGLRYAWRGDELETLINYRLGQLYIDNGEYLKGLSILRNAATITPELQIDDDVKTYMTKSYRDVFRGGKLEQVSPLEAISIYEEFKDLTPQGTEGDAFVETLAERLVDADLLGRAAALLDYQVNNRLQGDQKAEIAIRLAAIRLLDGNPDGALRSLDIAQKTLDALPGAPKAATQQPAENAPENVSPQAGDASPAAATAPVNAAAPEPATKQAETFDPEKQRQVYLLRARALSMKKKPDEAMAVLEGMTLDPDVNRLRTDIAWGAGKWEEAAMSLGDLITAEDISPRRPLTDYQQGLILNRAIALNLSGNRVALANMRERFAAQMKGTTKGQMFDVVSRPRRPDIVGSREAIESMISEIDLFKGFLDGYGKLDAADEAAKERAAVPTPQPVEKAVAKDTAEAAPAKTEAEVEEKKE